MKEEWQRYAIFNRWVVYGGLQSLSS